MLCQGSIIRNLITLEDRVLRHNKIYALDVQKNQGKIIDIKRKMFGTFRKTLVISKYTSYQFTLYLDIIE